MSDRDVVAGVHSHEEAQEKEFLDPFRTKIFLLSGLVSAGILIIIGLLMLFAFANPLLSKLAG